MSIDAAKISEILPHREALPETRLSRAIGRLFQWVARAVSWVWLFLMIIIVLNVVMRYAFGEGRVEFEEIQWHLYAVGFLVGLATCMSSDNHIRVDIFHERMSQRWQAWIELYGLLLMFFPFVFMVLLFSLPFVEYSFAISEISDAPGGLPYRWIIKSVLPVGMLLLILAGIGRLLRVTSFLFGSPAAIGEDGGTHVD